MKEDFDYGRIEWNVIDRNIQCENSLHTCATFLFPYLLLFFFLIEHSLKQYCFKNENSAFMQMFVNTKLLDRFLITVSQIYFLCILWLFKIDVF